jgi:cobalamin synthase
MKHRSSNDYIEDRLAISGALVFCSAVVVQILQLSTLTLALWIALTACAVAIPLLTSALVSYTLHERFTIRVDTRYSKVSGHIGLYATLLCAGAVFWHFSWVTGMLFITCATLSIILFSLDYVHHKKINGN